mgnify:CR=1 FL=1
MEAAATEPDAPATSTALLTPESVKAEVDAVLKNPEDEVSAVDEAKEMSEDVAKILVEVIAVEEAKVRMEEVAYRFDVVRAVELAYGSVFADVAVDVMAPATDSVPVAVMLVAMMSPATENIFHGDEVPMPK